eukprot:7015408-Lingulodinium_polyedra.AAC.1
MRKFADRCSPASQCPLRSMRVPELAAGALNTFCEDLFSISNAELLCDPSVVGLNEADRLVVLSDFAAAR